MNRTISALRVAGSTSRAIGLLARIVLQHDNRLGIGVLRLSLMAAMLAITASFSIAASIAVDFVGGSATGSGGTSGGGAVTAMGSTEVAGVIPQRFWNNAGVGGQADPFENSSGSLGAGSISNNLGATIPNFSVSWTAFNTFSTFIADTPGNNRMMKGYLDTSSSNPFVSSDTLVTVSNLPSVFTGGGFDLYVYYDGLINVGSANRVGQYEVFNGPNTAGPLLGTIYGADTSSFAGTFIRASGTTAANATSGNYVEFTGLHAGTFTLQAFGAAGDVPRAPINGIQIVAETPEPSSLFLLAIGGLALGGAALRRVAPAHGNGHREPDRATA